MTDNILAFTPKVIQEDTSLDDIRREIDRIDRQLVSMIADRYVFVKAVTQFKKTEDDGQAPERYNAVLEAKRLLAVEHGLEPDMVEGMWRVMMDWFIAEEKDIIAERNAREEKARAEKIDKYTKDMMVTVQNANQQTARADDLMVQAKALANQATQAANNMDQPEAERYRAAAEICMKSSQCYLETADTYANSVRLYNDAKTTCVDIIEVCNEATEARPDKDKVYLPIREAYVNAEKSYQDTGKILATAQRDCLQASEQYMEISDTYLELSKS